MAEADTCRALTTDGSRCSRPARENGFCYQHDEDDPTIDEEMPDDEASDDEASDEEEASNEEEETSDGETSNGQSEQTGREHNMSEPDDEHGSSDPDLMKVRETVHNLASDVIGRPLDGIIEVSNDGEEWRAVVEVIERRSVPDTQDILGRYEIEVSDGASIVGYRRLERYRRGDMTQDEL